MQIDPALLSEDKYTGTRLIEITNSKVRELMKEVGKIQKQANPILDEMDKILKGGLEEFQRQIQIKRSEIVEIQNQMKPQKDEYDVLLKRVELKDNKAQLIKNKIQPLVDQELEGQLGEFEKPLHVVVKDHKIYVEVQDSLEEFIKQKRDANSSSPSSDQQPTASEPPANA